MYWSTLSYLRVVWWVILDNPVHLRDIESSGSNISTEQDARVGITELEKCGGPLCLLLFTL